jgi:hypothetical protein
MRESRTSGFVRGAHSNMCPYRDLISFLSPSADGGREQRFGEVFSKRSVQDVCK